MMSRWMLVLAIVFAWVALPSVAEDSPPSNEDEALLAWVDELDWPDFASKPFVRVATGNYGRRPHAQKNLYVHGFLLSDDGIRFTALRLGDPAGGFGPVASANHEFLRTPEGTPERARVGFETVDAAPLARELLEQFSGPTPPRVAQTDGIRWTPTGVLMLARNLEGTGRAPLAARLIEGARFQTREGTLGLSEAARAEIASNTMWRSVLAFGRPAVTFAQLLGRFAYFVERFPDSSHFARAEEALGLLETMAAEQEAHDAARRPIEAMTEPERIQELVFQLRTQNGHQWSQPGACSIWNDARDGESPAAQLLALGYAAVPALIEVVDDRRFTRSVGFHRDFYFSHHVLRVGDVANTVLSEITGGSYYVRPSTWGAMAEDGDASAVKAHWRRWWKTFQEKGERVLLIDSVRETANVEHARRLWKRYPEEAVPIILAALPKTTGSWHRSALLALIGDLPGEEAARVLHAELKASGDPKTRLAVARLLQARGHRDAVPALLEQWRELEAPHPGRDELIEALAHSGEIAALEGLLQGLDQRPPPVRIELVRSFAGVARRLRGEDPGAFALEYRDGVEALLVGLLGDTEPWRGCRMSFNGDHFGNPRVCDMTAFTLHEIWPTRYPPFDPDLSLLQRTRQCVETANLWRRRHDLAPLPLPEPPAIQPMDAAAAEVLLRRARQAESVETSEEALRELASHGLGALPFVRDALQDPGCEADLRTALETLAKRLALTVREVSFRPTDLVPDTGPVRTFAAGLAGAPLQADDFIGVLTRFCAARPQGVSGMILTVHGDGNDRGLDLVLEWVPGQATPGDGGTWKTTQALRAGSEQLTQSGGVSAYGYLQKVGAWRAYQGSLERALSTALDTPFEGFVSIRYAPR